MTPAEYANIYEIVKWVAAAPFAALGLLFLSHLWRKS